MTIQRRLNADRYRPEAISYLEKSTGKKIEIGRQGFVTNLFAQLAGGTPKDGKVSFPFHVRGTIDNPVFAKGE